MADLVGKTLVNRYHVVEFLGRGGMSEVYKVWDGDRMDYLAAKVLLKSLALDRVFLRRFRREAESLQQLQHRAIVRYYGLFQDGKIAFMLLDYIEGMTLQEKIFEDGADVNPEDLTQLMQSMCGALRFAHIQGLVHCDIKPGNIMINQFGQFLLTDFGIARMTDAATSTMVGFGTPAYMAPELVQGKDPTPQSDIYSLGVVLYEMVTGGERPFIGERAKITGTTSEKVRWEQANLAPPSPRGYNPIISPALEAVILRCLEKDPSKRFPGALELLNAAVAAMDGGTTDEALIKRTSEDAFARKSEESGKIKNEPSKGEPSAPKNGADQRSNAQPMPESGKRKKLPAWMWISALVVLILGLVLTLGGNLLRLEKAGEGSSDKNPVMINSIDGAAMVYIPAGEFIMGSDAGRPDELPMHTVYLDAFWMYQFEVTNQQYAEFLNQIGNKSEVGKPWLDADDNDTLISESSGEWQVLDGFADHPVIEVNWYGAIAYCEWAGGSLPTEAEWEKAARGTDGRIYPWGQSGVTGATANYCDINCGNDGWAGKSIDDGYSETAPVGSYPDGASPYGAMDMAGNVWEWVADWFNANYYEMSSEANPTGPEEGMFRVLRGGSWSYIESSLRTSARYKSVPVNAVNFVGFRCRQGVEP